MRFKLTIFLATAFFIFFSSIGRADASSDIGILQPDNISQSLYISDKTLQKQLIMPDTRAVIAPNVETPAGSTIGAPSGRQQDPAELCEKYGSAIPGCPKKNGIEK